MAFPSAKSIPAIYSFRFTGPRGLTEYVGESADLAKRWYAYSRPGPSQRTNLRLNPILRDAVDHHGPVEVRIVTQASLHLGDEHADLNLADRWARIMIESDAMKASEAGTTLNISEVQKLR